MEAMPSLSVGFRPLSPNVRNSSGSSSGSVTEGETSFGQQGKVEEQSRQPTPRREQTREDPSNSENESYFDPDEHGFRRIVRNFAPSWYIVTMGTGVVALLLHEIPYHARWLNRLSEVFFVLDILLFVVFTIMSGLRYSMYPELFGALLRDKGNSFFLGTVPTGFFLINDLIVLICVPAWGHGFVTLAWTFWWIGTVFALVIFSHLTFMVINITKKDLSSMSAFWLLSIVPAVIAATSGGIVAEVLPNPQHQLWTLIISYILWGTSMPLAFIILVLYFHRLTVHETLSKQAVVTVFLPIAPLGLGGYALIQFGIVAMKVFPLTHTLELVPNAAEILYVLGFIVALFMWGFGIVWFFLASAMVIQSRGFPFSMGWWSFTFPIGVFALSTMTIGNAIESRFFKVLGTVLTVIVIVLWAVVAVPTVKGAISGKLFHAPCLETDIKLKELKEQKLRRLSEKRAESGLR